MLLATIAGVQCGGASAKGKAAHAVVSTSEEMPAIGVLDLNSASEEALITLPGLGLSGAKSIISNRPYASLEDFVSRGIVPRPDFEKFRDGVIVVVSAGQRATAGSSQADE